MKEIKPLETNDPTLEVTRLTDLENGIYIRTVHNAVIKQWITKAIVEATGIAVKAEYNDNAEGAAASHRDFCEYFRMQV